MQSTKSYQNIALAGFVLWLAAVIFFHSNFQQETWVRLLLALAALVWIPFGLSNINTHNVLIESVLQYGIFYAAMLLGVALIFDAGVFAGILTFPWLVITFFIALRGISYFRTSLKPSVAIITISAAHLFLFIGGIWTMADRLGLQPLGFSASIVLLTGVHFHYAGFIFPLLAGLATLHYPSVWSKIGCGLAIIAVPLTAAGITITQIWHLSFLEMCAAATVVLAGWSTAIAYLHFIIKQKITGLVRWCWLIMAFALFASMAFAFLYAIRIWFLTPWLTIPMMWALHGTMNALLVSGGGLLGWWLWAKKNYKLRIKPNPHL